MIELLNGDNSFEIAQALRQRQTAFDGLVERFEGSELTAGQLVDIFSGQTLFATKRLIIIDHPSECSQLWHNLEGWLTRVADETHVVLVEPSIDKRTSAFKWLQSHATTHVYMAWTPRDRRKAASWLTDYTAQNGLALSPDQTNRLLNRAGFDQWQLHHAVTKLALFDEITDQRIDDSAVVRPDENVFSLLETALQSDAPRLLEMLDGLRRSEDAYRVFGLLTSQVLQLALLVHASGSIKKVVQDTAARPFMLERLAPQAARLNKAETKRIVRLFAEADRRLKSSDADPWTVIEVTLLQINEG